MGVQKTVIFLGLWAMTPLNIGRRFAVRRVVTIETRLFLRTIGRRFVNYKVVFNVKGLVISKVLKWERRFVTSWMNS